MSLKGVVMHWTEFRRRLWWLFYNRNNITYCLGCAGEVAGRDRIVENNFKYYWGHGWAEKIAKDIPDLSPDDTAADAWAVWLSYNAGKMCFDCSGLVCWCIGLEGVHKYSSWDFGKMPENESISAGVEMSILWKQGHVSIDIGGGYEMEIGDYNHTIEFGKISDRNFEKSVLCAGIDYKGARNE